LEKLAKDGDTILKPLFHTAPERMLRALAATFLATQQSN
jgi:hypothetical protein